MLFISYLLITKLILVVLGCLSMERACTSLRCSSITSLWSPCQVAHLLFKNKNTILLFFYSGVCLIFELLKRMPSGLDSLVNFKIYVLNMLILILLFSYVVILTFNFAQEKITFITQCKLAHSGIWKDKQKKLDGFLFHSRFMEPSFLLSNY